MDYLFAGMNSSKKIQLRIGFLKLIYIPVCMSTPNLCGVTGVDFACYDRS